MPLVIVAGHPCSGKSTVAEAAAAVLEAAGLQVHVVSENAWFPDRSRCYATLAQEKDTRAKLRSETDRHLSRNTTIILDSLNTVKGYRYELWCLARAAGTRCSVLWVQTDPATCRAWNAARASTEAYTEDVLEDLLRRFEAPNPQTRWDTPLHTVEPTSATPLADALAPLATALTTATSGSAGAQLVLRGPNAVVAQELTPNLATTALPRSATNALHDLDAAAQAVVACVSSAQADAGPGLAPGRVQVPSGDSLELRAPCNAAELRRLKRAFLKAMTAGSDGRVLTGEAGTRAFVAYLRDNLACAAPQ